MKKDFILNLYQSKNTVFTINEIALLSGEIERFNLKSKINYYVKKGELRNVRKGIYTKIEYDPFELAAKIFTPSYISLETVLKKEGVIFQTYETIFVVSYLSRKIEVDSHPIQYRRLKEQYLLAQDGIIQKQNYAIATKERAFLDVLYLYGEYYFDNLEVLDKEKIFALLDIFQSETLLKRAKEILKNA
ncbi:MAG: hypothetical protein KAX11_07080 [Candidatus Aminicenantes bacterium]|nr:hypothetical protein [Candidatus Aminicenantes bacterium]